MITAMDLSEAGHKVEIFESRPFMGGKVGSWQDKDGNHIEMGLHVFFGCYYNFFGIFRRLGIFDSALRLKVHQHQFVNKVSTVEGGGGGEERAGNDWRVWNPEKCLDVTTSFSCQYIVSNSPLWDPKQVWMLRLGWDVIYITLSSTAVPVVCSGYYRVSFSARHAMMCRICEW